MKSPNSIKVLTAPPDPFPKKPKFVCPPGSWDCHVHIYGPATQFQFNEGCPYSSNDALAETYLQQQDVLGLQKAVLVNGAGYGLNNEHLRFTLEHHPTRFKGVCYLSPQTPISEIRDLKALGVRAARFVTGPAWAHLPELDDRTAYRIHDEGLHLELFTFANGGIAPLKERLLALPNVIVIDHFGMLDATKGPTDPGFRVLLELLETDRVFIKMSRPMNAPPHIFPYPAITEYARILVAAAPHRLLWGSDWPHVQMNGLQMPNDGDLLDLMLDWVPDDATRNKILAENPLILYGDDRDVHAIASK